jgi:pSer/pThr/pTyr-binding forkhead associated (FHA) protein
MAGLRAGKTLFEAVPALGAISALGGAFAKLLPVGFEHPAVELVEGVNRVGRDPAQNDHVIASSHISRTHCEILVSNGTIWVKDLKSHNGTFVNGERVERSEIKPGDKLGLSRRVTFVLAMDETMENPIDVEVEMEGEQTQVTPPPPAAKPPPPPPPPAPGPVSTKPGPHGAPAQEASSQQLDSFARDDDAEPDPAVVLKQVEQQRNVLAILYQISLHCLMADNQKEIEQLLTNVLQRLVPLDSGFVLYQTGGAWRASICPNSRVRPADATVRSFYQLAAQHQEALVIEAPDDLASLGLEGGSAMMVPMILGDMVSGVVGTISTQTGVYSAEILDIMRQLANVSAAALRDR